MRFTPNKKGLIGETLEEFTADLEQAKFPKYRAKQVFDWVFKKKVSISVNKIPI